MSTSFFVEMAWKSALVAGVALLLAVLLRSRSAADRAVVLQAGIGLLLLLPLVAVLLPALQVEVALAAAEPQPMSIGMMGVPDAAGTLLAGLPAEETAVSSGSLHASIALIMVYLAGLLMAALRLASGLWKLRRWTSAAEPVSCPKWSRALARQCTAAGAPALSLRVSAEVPAPLSWGWRRPVVLIDTGSHRRAEDADAILAHEIAHVVRRDWPALMASRIAAALFWFNPLVWLLEREFIRNAEEASDQRAVAQVERTDYAQALLGCARQTSGAPLPANSIGSGDLSRRIRTVLEGRSMPSGSRLAVAALIGCLGVSGPVTAIELVPCANARPARAAVTVPARSVVGVRPVVLAAASSTPAAAAAPATAAARKIAAPATAKTAAPKPAPAPRSPAPALAAVSAELAAARAPAGAAAPAAAGFTAEKGRRFVVVPNPEAPVVVVNAGPAPSPSPRRRVLVIKDGKHAHGPDYEAAMREVAEASAEAARAGERASRAGARAQAIAHARARRSMASGAIAMEKGADDMVRGSRHMAEEAERLRDFAYREKQIARDAARGHTVTHQELIDAIPQLQKGSRDMIKGAADMRKGAAHMRRQAEAR